MTLTALLSVAWLNQDCRLTKTRHCFRLLAGITANVFASQQNKALISVSLSHFSVYDGVLSMVSYRQRLADQGINMFV